MIKNKEQNDKIKKTLLYYKYDIFLYFLKPYQITWDY